MNNTSSKLLLSNDPQDGGPSCCKTPCSLQLLWGSHRATSHIPHTCLQAMGCDCQLDASNDGGSDQ